MFIIKILGKVLALPVIVLLGVGVTLCGIVEKISGFVIGIFNILAALAIAYAFFVAKNHAMLKNGFFLLLGENVFFVIVGLSSEIMKDIQEQLMGFVCGAQK